MRIMTVNYWDSADITVMQREPPDPSPTPSHRLLTPHFEKDCEKFAARKGMK